MKVKTKEIRELIGNKKALKAKEIKSAYDPDKPVVHSKLYRDI